MPLPVFLSLVSRLEDQGYHHGGDYRCGDAACCGRQTTSEDTQPALLRHRLFNALGQRVAKARQGHRGPGSAPICQWLLQTPGTEEHAGDHIARQNTGGGQPGAVDQNLTHGAEKSAAEKCVKICHTPYLSVLTHTRWQMPGIDSP